MATPNLTQLKTYLGDASLSDDELTRTLAVEVAAQADVCTVPDPVTDPLEEAAYRRVACNLARRNIPTAIFGVDETTPSVVPLHDPEVRRLEGPYRIRRKTVFG